MEVIHPWREDEARPSPVRRSKNIILSSSSENKELVRSNQPNGGSLLSDDAAGNSSSANVQDEQALVTIGSPNREITTNISPEPTELASKMTEILKSIIYGGLSELIASLGVVTSAAATHATTVKIVASSFASLICGIFVFGYKLGELWTNEHQTGADEAEAVDNNQLYYEELLGDRKNYRLHSTVAVISFLIFGLVPPLVYGFSFPNPKDKDLKLVAVTGVSILCIVLLASMKAHIQKPKNCLMYFKIIGDHVVDGVGVSVVTTFSGDLIEKYVEQFGWFDTNKMSTLLLPAVMASANYYTWRSY